MLTGTPTRRDKTEGKMASNCQIARHCATLLFPVLFVLLHYCTYRYVHDATTTTVNTMGATTSIALQQEIDKPLDASDLGTPQSAIQEVARLRKLMHPPAPRPLKGVMVDCGSGHTSIICYTHTAGGQTNQHAKLSIRTDQGGNYPLTDAFSNDTTAHFIHQLNQE